MMILPVMVAGDTPVDTWTLALPSNAAQDLTGVQPQNLTLILTDKQSGTTLEGTGSFTVPSETASQGIVTYGWTTADTARPGTYQIAVRVTFPNGQVLTFGVVNRVTQIIVSA